MLLRAIDNFFKHDAAGGILLMLSAVAALVVANSAFSGAYESALGSTLAILVNGEGLQKPMILWINDGLMAIFFFLIGLELKREMLEGKLKDPRDIVLPGVAALGGRAGRSRRRLTLPLPWAFWRWLANARLYRSRFSC